MTSRKMVLVAALLTATWSPTLHRTQAAAPPTQAIVSQSLSQWAHSRGCLYTANADGLLLKAIFAEGEQIEPIKIRYALESYLDWLAVESFGELRTNCVVSANLLRKLPFDFGTYASPSKGYLKVDGTKKGAEIYIDGKLKGYIDQLFALSLGNHRVKTMKCDFAVKIEADKRKDLFCSKG